MPARRFHQVIFADDLFRSPANGLNHFPANRRFLKGFFGSALGRLGLPMREIAPRSHGGAIDVAHAMALLGLPATPAGWARACIADLAPLRELEGWPAFGPGCLVIGWGLTPALQHAIDRGGASYLDIEIDPRRFTEHLHFCARTNDARIRAALEARAIGEELFWNHAASLQGFFARRGAGALFDPRLRVGVFFGQSLVDLSLVSGGRSQHPSAVIGALRTLAQEVDLLVVKPHPYEPALHDLAPIARAIPNVAWTRENSYALLSADNVRFVAGLSSSVLTEARYFLKPTRALIRADRNAPECLPAGCSPWMPVGPELGSLDFVLEACQAPESQGLIAASTGDAGAWPADAIERAFSTRWGLDDDSPGLQPLPELVLGRDYAFRTGNPATAWLAHGWAAPDDVDTWSEGALACLAIPLPPAAVFAHPLQAPAQRLRVRIDYRCEAKGTRVVALLDGAMLPGQRTTGAWRRSLVFELVPSPQRKCLVLQFFVGEAAGAEVADGTQAPVVRSGFTLRRLRVSMSATGTGGVAALPQPEASAAAPGRVLDRMLRVFLPSGRRAAG